MAKMKIPPAIADRIDVVERNNPDEAEDIVRSCVYEMGYCPSSVAHYLFKMQDDDGDLRARVRGMDIRPMPGAAEVQ